MKVGDLVVYCGEQDPGDPSIKPLGIILDFDDEDDPIVAYPTEGRTLLAYFRSDMEVISASG